ncbi:hypothetical protein TGME49_323500 [Toxoplasma gondii ME49]|uniref:Uncharacterized protein n=1 Tax=Toxoplasma gondii (strain ATCC 50611 / Me49) TaxID=508771 RepID=S8FZ51_TOXGM|nr:hypothetical protein TGME49_323500 [Toxoplasma gondii ME49]EPT24495.1 hypothetical protein TGME49_323500 [Toxoplasma gondii ME49]|eukprot:XP_018634733.1 hypothetical protein TGME49_323500 [Toxoplasma gondii ME49]
MACWKERVYTSSDRGVALGAVCLLAIAFSVGQSGRGRRTKIVESMDRRDESEATPADARTTLVVVQCLRRSWVCSQYEPSRGVLFFVFSRRRYVARDKVLTPLPNGREVFGGVGKLCVTGTNVLASLEEAVERRLSNRWIVEMKVDRWKGRLRTILALLSSGTRVGRAFFSGDVTHEAGCLRNVMERRRRRYVARDKVLTPLPNGREVFGGVGKLCVTGTNVLASLKRPSNEDSSNRWIVEMKVTLRRVATLSMACWKERVYTSSDRGVALGAVCLLAIAFSVGQSGRGRRTKIVESMDRRDESEATPADARTTLVVVQCLRRSWVCSQYEPSRGVLFFVFSRRRYVARDKVLTPLPNGREVFGGVGKLCVTGTNVLPSLEEAVERRLSNRWIVEMKVTLRRVATLSMACWKERVYTSSDRGVALGAVCLLAIAFSVGQSGRGRRTKIVESMDRRDESEATPADARTTLVVVQCLRRSWVCSQYEPSRGVLFFVFSRRRYVARDKVLTPLPNGREVFGGVGKLCVTGTNGDSSARRDP